MSDFNYEFGSVSGEIVYGFYMDENTFISYALKESGSTRINPQMCLLYKRENPQHPFYALETTFLMGCFCLNENGAGVFNSSNTAFLGKLKENNPELIKTTGVGVLSPATLFLKNSVRRLRLKRLERTAAKKNRAFGKSESAVSTTLNVGNKGIIA